MAALKFNATVPTPSERSTTLLVDRARMVFGADLQNLAWIAAVAIVYYAAGKVGFYFASFTASSTSVWPPSGIAFAAMLLLGYQIWPGIFLGAFFVNLAISGAVFASLGIATGNTLEAVVAVYLTMRYANGPRLFEHSQDFFRFAALGMLAAAMSATIGVMSLALGGLAHWNEFVRIWVTWWLGDVGGFLLFAPFPILWIENPRLSADHRRLLESSLVLAVITVFGVAVFAGAVPEIAQYRIGFVCFPMLVWCAFRFGQREAATAIFVLTVSAEWGMIRGHGPWALFASQISSFIMPQAFMITMAVMTMALAAVVWERKRAEEDANEARNQAVAANRAKDQFLAMLGHELRNPIAALSSAVRVLEHSDVPAQQYSTLLEIMVRQSGHLSRMVDDLLDVQRFTASRITLNRRPMNLAECARDCVTALRLREGYADHNIILRIEDTWIDGDPDRVAQILTNLLSNACKYTRPQGKIVLGIRPENDCAFICVEDDGDGIPADLLPRVFELFVQGDRLSDRHPGGLGLGLTLVRRLSELHGGTIDAHSDGPGRGARFTVRIPRIEARIVVQSTTRATPARSRRGRRILIVEDNTDAREALRQALEMSGHEIFEADSGASGVESALANHPDTALIDIGLPGFDGYEVARRIRSSSENRGIVLIALTGYGSPEDRRRAKQAGFDTHLVKPLNFDLLDDLLTTRGEPILEKSAASQR